MTQEQQDRILEKLSHSEIVAYAAINAICLALFSESMGIIFKMQQIPLLASSIAFFLLGWNWNLIVPDTYENFEEAGNDSLEC